jgi:hypothetical protein
VRKESSRIEKTFRSQTEKLEQQLAEFHKRLVAAGKDTAHNDARVAELVSAKADRIQEALLSQATKLEAKRSKTHDQLLEKVSGVEAALNEALGGPRREDGELDELEGRLRAAVERLDGLEQLVQSATTDILARFDAQVVPESEPGGAEAEEPVEDEEPVVFSEHLVFVPSKSGYSLRTIEFPPPKVGAEIEFGETGDRFLVTKVADSPFPHDERPCAYLQYLN